MARKTAASKPAGGGLAPLLGWVALAGAAAAVVFAWNFQGKLEAQRQETSARLTAMDARLGELAQEVAKARADLQAQAQRPAPQPQPQQPRGPDPNRVYPVSLAGVPTKGPADAAVTIVEVSDFQCPFCARVVPTLEKVEQVYGPLVRRAFKQYPLSFHQDAPLAAAASIAAQEQGKFWEYKKLLFANQKDLKRPALVGYARKLGLDVAKFEAGLDSAAAKQRIAAEMSEAQAIGITGTPGFLINGRFLSGAQPFEAFAKLINQELQKKGVAIPAGAQGI